MRRPRFCLFDVPHLQDAFTENNDSGKGHGTASGTRREPILGGLGIASLLCTVPVAAPQPLPLEHRGYSSQSKIPQNFPLAPSRGRRVAWGTLLNRDV